MEHRPGMATANAIPAAKNATETKQAKTENMKNRNSNDSNKKKTMKIQTEIQFADCCSHQGEPVNTHSTWRHP